MRYFFVIVFCWLVTTAEVSLRCCFSSVCVACPWCDGLLHNMKWHEDDCLECYSLYANYHMQFTSNTSKCMEMFQHVLHSLTGMLPKLHVQGLFCCAASCSFRLLVHCILEQSWLIEGCKTGGDINICIKLRIILCVRIKGFLLTHNSLDLWQLQCFQTKSAFRGKKELCCYCYYTSSVCIATAQAWHL